jgi:hypothetical protein
MESVAMRLSSLAQDQSRSPPHGVRLLTQSTGEVKSTLTRGTLSAGISLHGRFPRGRTDRRNAHDHRGPMFPGAITHRAGFRKYRQLSSSSSGLSRAPGRGHSHRYEPAVCRTCERRRAGRSGEGRLPGGQRPPPADDQRFTLRVVKPPVVITSPPSSLGRGRPSDPRSQGSWPGTAG